MSITHLPAHPRSRGENIAEQGWDAYALGSSPLTRGKRVRISAERIIRRLIPAHAGKTSRLTDSAATWAAHPRSRGENEVGPGAFPSPVGSSPLTRGKRLDHIHPRLGRRLIPAHAGKTEGAVRPQTSQRAHPRSRGENADSIRSISPVGGSSPLTRGKPLRCSGSAGGFGLIPAHAGKTVGRRTGGLAARAHPRSRGENVRFLLPTSSRHGSSPLTRGKRGAMLTGNDGLRLIPAHAGKTPLRRWRQGRGAAHPRSRGENVGIATETLVPSGSSPLTRGKRPPPIPSL